MSCGALQITFGNTGNKYNEYFKRNNTKLSLLWGCLNILFWLIRDTEPSVAGFGLQATGLDG